MATSTKAKPTRAGRPAGRFTQHRRLDKLRDVLEGHPSGLGIGELATLLRVTSRSVRRYLQELDRHVQLESVATRPGGTHVWRIKPSERSRAVMLRRTQAYGLLATRHVFEVLKGSALYDELDVALRQLGQIANRPTRAGGRGEMPNDQKLEERFVFLPPSPRNYGARGEDLDDIFQAVANCRAIHCRYRAPSEGGLERTGGKGDRLVLEPYALLIHRGSIVCLGRDRASGQVRPFWIEGMVEPTSRDEERFVLPADFDPSPYLHGEFGIHAPGPEHRVLIEFDARLGDEIRARKIHPTQKLATAPDGRTRLSMTVPDIAPVVPWIVAFGGAARVVEPPELVDEVVRVLRGALARYTP